MVVLLLQLVVLVALFLPPIQDRLLELVQNQLQGLVHALHQDLVPGQAPDQDQDTVQ